MESMNHPLPACIGGTEMGIEDLWEQAFRGGCAFKFGAARLNPNYAIG